MADEMSEQLANMQVDGQVRSLWRFSHNDGFVTRISWSGVALGVRNLVIMRAGVPRPYCPERRQSAAAPGVIPISRRF